MARAPLPVRDVVRGTPVAPGKVEPEEQYRVKLTRNVTHGGVILRPRDDLIVKGKVVAALGDAVDKIETI